MTELTNIEEYLKRQNELLDRLTQINNEDFKTKREIIQELIDATRPLFEAGYYQWKKWFFASFIYQQLEQYNIEYPRGESFYNLFKDDEIDPSKRGTNILSLKVTECQHDFQGDSEPKQCPACSAILFQSLIYDVVPPKEKEEKGKQSDNKRKEEKPLTECTYYLEFLQINCEELKSQGSDLKKKYENDENVAKTIDSALPNIYELIEEQLSTLAKLEHMGKQSDFRQKLGEFEKVKSIILCESTYNLAKVAKLLSITPKHQAHNIITNLKTYLSNMKWFRSLVFECRKCQAENVIELADWYNEQVERKTLGLNMIKP